MLILRRALVWLRDLYDQDRQKYFTLAIGATLAFVIITMLVDYFLPFHTFSNLLRSVLLVPTASALFSLGYGVGLYLHGQRMENEDWVPYRARFSPAWRRRIAVIVAALIIVVAQGIEAGFGYTLTSSLLGAVIIATLAFIRTSRQEANREELGIPDSRDVLYDAEKRRFERERALKAAAKKKNKNSKSNKAGEAKRNKASS